MATTAVTPEIQTSVQTVQPADVTVNDSAESIAAAHAAEKAAIESAPPVVEAAPVAPAETVPTKPYSITKNDDGSVKLDFITDKGVKESFTGTMDEVLDKVAASKVSGDELIKKLNTTQPQTTVPPVEQTQAPKLWMPAPEISAAAVDKMVSTGDFSDVVSIGLTQLFGGENPEQVKAAISELFEMRQETRAQQDIAKFTQAAPDFPWAKENTDLLFSTLEQRGMPATTENLVLAHNALKGMGAYKPANGTVVQKESPNPQAPTKTVQETAPQGIDWSVEPLDSPRWKSIQG